MKQFIPVFLGVVLFACLAIEIHAAGECIGRSKTIQCSGCRTYDVCFPGVEDPSPQVECESQLPYCAIGGENGDYCAKNRDPNNKACDKEEPGGFLCVGEADEYPEPTNCRMFYHCYNMYQLISRPEYCVDKHYYNSKTRQCTKQTSSSQCWTTDCTKGSVQEYKPDPQFWIQCVLNRMFVNRCDKYLTFSLAAGCHFTCKSEGFFPHHDPTRYYYCYKNGSKLVYEERECPNGVFNPTTKTCDYAPPSTTTPDPTTTTPEDSIH